MHAVLKSALVTAAALLSTTLSLSSAAEAALFHCALFPINEEPDENGMYQYYATTYSDVGGCHLDNVFVYDCSTLYPLNDPRLYCPDTGNECTGQVTIPGDCSMHVP